MVRIELTDANADELEQLLIDIVYKQPIKSNRDRLFDILAIVEKAGQDYRASEKTVYSTTDPNASWNQPK